MIDALLTPFRTMTTAAAVGWLFAVNVGLFLASLVVGGVLVRLYHDRPVTAEPDPTSTKEWVLAACSVVLNTAVTVAGWLLWRHGWIAVRPTTVRRTLLDVAVLFVAMDLLMYLFHRVAHVRWLFPLLHATHHEFDRPRPLDLFVLNPAEVLGFGGLWLALLCLYPATWAGILTYLAINLAFGTLGHLGVEPFPRAIAGWPVLRHLGSSTFHAAHHGERAVNFGFYTDVWDRLFRTHARPTGTAASAAIDGG